MKKVLLTLALVMLFSVKAVASENVVILLDTSGSMDTRMRGNAKTRMQAAQDALIAVTTQFPDDTNVGILTFTGWVYALQPINKAEVAAAIKKTAAGGGTPLGKYMKDGADALLKLREKNKGIGTYRLIVVTDGEATDYDVMNRYAPEIPARGIVLNTIGVDMSSDHALKRVSKKYMNADDPASLQNAVETALAEVGKSSSDDGAGNFDMLNGLDEGGAKSIISGLTEQQNHGIDDPAPVRVVDENGNVKWVTPDKADAGGSGLGLWWIVIAVAVILVVGVIVIIIGNSNGRS